MSEQCTAVITTYRPFTIGGNTNQVKQCESDAEYIVTEKSSGETMPLCARCLREFWNLNADDEGLYIAAAKENDV